MSWLRYPVMEKMLPKSPYGLALPAINQYWMRIGALALVFAYLLTLLPGIVWAARHMDKLAEQRVAPWDDTDYQTLAINLLHGFGFTETLRLPIEEYKTVRDESSFIHDDGSTFYRAPGFVFLLAGLYAITGVSTLAARLMIGITIWLTLILLLWIGDRLAGWVGSLAAGLASYYIINVSLLVRGPESFYSGRILSEPMTAFLVSLFALLCILYLQKKRLLFLYLASFSLASVVLTRANFLAALPLFLLLVFLYTRQWKPVLISAAILFLPVIAWSAYASMTRQSLVLLTIQGSQDFPRFNNQDVITGFGPEKLNQGGWQPGFARGPEGDLIITNSNGVRAGENGWIKGLQFWWSNPQKLPKLFYTKLRAGLWYKDGLVYLLGIGLFLVGLGFRKPYQSTRIMPGLNSKQVLGLQIGLCSLLIWLPETQSFWKVLLIWGIIGLLALLRPYGDAGRPILSEVSWAIPLIAAHLLTTLLFGGDPRFHFPIDPLVVFFGFAGTLLTAYYLLKHDLWLALLSGLLVAIRVIKP